MSLDLCPGQLLPNIFGLFDAGAGRAHQVFDLGIAGAQVLQLLFGGNSPIHQPHPIGFAIKGFDILEHLRQRLLVQNVAVEDFVADGESFGGDHQRQHHLLAIEAMIAAIAIAGLGNFLGLPLEIGAGQIVKKHIQPGSEEIFPTPLQMEEKRLAMVEQSIQNTIKLVFASPHKFLSQQIAHGAAVIPKPVASPFASRIDQPISNRDRQHFYPVRPLAAGGYMLVPKCVQLQFPPQLACQPAGPILARSKQTVRVQAQTHIGGDNRRGSHNSLLGKKVQAWSRRDWVFKDVDGCGPFGLLGVA